MVKKSNKYFAQNLAIIIPRIGKEQKSLLVLCVNLLKYFEILKKKKQKN